MDILNVASPRGNDYNGDFSEKSVIIHAINYFKENTHREYVSRIFFNINKTKERILIEAHMLKSPIFSEVYAPTATNRVFEVDSEWLSDVLLKEAEEVYQKSIKPKETERPAIVLNQNKYFTAGRDIKDQSSLSNDFSSNKMNEIIKSDKSQYPGFKKISHWIISHIVQILIGLLIAYFVFKFGWN